MHVYTENMQPATGWVDIHSAEPMQMGFAPEEMIYAHCCNEKRPAKDCVVQSYYDGLAIWCATDKGCKDPQVIAEKRARAFANRSAAQKARWEATRRQARPNGECG